MLVCKMAYGYLVFCPSHHGGTARDLLQQFEFSMRTMPHYIAKVCEDGELAIIKMQHQEFGHLLLLQDDGCNSPLVAAAVHGCYRHIAVYLLENGINRIFCQRFW